VDPHAKLASFYMVSGLCMVSGPGRSCTNYAGTISVFTRRYRRDSGRPALRGLARRLLPPRCARCAFSGQKTEDWLRELARMRKDSKSNLFFSPLSKRVRGVHVPDAGPDGAQRLLTKSVKVRIPGTVSPAGQFPLTVSVEIVNSALAPPTTCHAFTFTVPRHDNLARRLKAVSMSR